MTARSAPSAAGAWALLALLVAAAIAGSALASAYKVREAPPFRLTTTGLEAGADGVPQTLELHALRGRTVVIDLMAVACAPCRIVTHETLLPLWQRHGHDPRFALVSIDAWSDPAAVPGFAETEPELSALQQAEGLPWPHAIDRDRVWAKYDALQLPKLVVVAPDGTIAYEASGRVDPAKVHAAVAASLQGDAPAAPVLRVGLGAGAFLAGAATFASPCSVGLLPAYLGLMAGQRGRLARAGLLAAAGAVAAYALLSAALLALALAGLGAWARARLTDLVPAVAVLLVAAGLLTLMPVPWRWPAVAASRLAGRGPFAFGAAFALAGFGCAGPVALPVLTGAFLTSPAAGAAATLLFSAGLGGLMLATAWAVGAGRGRALGRAAASPWASRALGVALVAAGAWMLWRDARAGLL